MVVDSTKRSWMLGWPHYIARKKMQLDEVLYKMFQKSDKEIMNKIAALKSQR